MADAGDKLEYLKTLERKARVKECLPHLHGYKWYPWARTFFESTNKYNFICAANQISKSSTQIRKCIHWATDVRLWQKLWPKSRPKQFWYLYPDKNVATAEFNEKWIKEFLPRDEFKDHPAFGWKAEYKSKVIHAVHFNSGVSVYFKSYEQDPQSLQAASIYALFADEEMPLPLYDELNVRTIAVEGYFHMVFTATLGQEFWRETIEERGKFERFPDALKIQVSMYDCLAYEDDSASSWTVEKIDQFKRSCKSEAEVLRRVYGRFVLDEDLKYEGFTKSNNLVADHGLPKDWLIFSGVDVGSGGSSGHPAAICFVAVKPDFTKGRVFKGWRGDGVSTTAGDVLQRYRELKASLRPVAQYYDWQCKDFFTIASRQGEPFQPADKSHETGESILNTLFKNGMLKIYDTPELRKLVMELENLKRSTAKTKAKDDFTDALRYAVTRIPWDYSLPRSAEHGPKKPQDPRMIFYQGPAPVDDDGLDLFESEFDEANELMDYYQEDDPF